MVRDSLSAKALSLLFTRPPQLIQLILQRLLGDKQLGPLKHIFERLRSRAATMSLERDDTLLVGEVSAGCAAMQIVDSGIYVIGVRGIHKHMGNDNSTWEGPITTNSTASGSVTAETA